MLTRISCLSASVRWIMAVSQRMLNLAARSFINQSRHIIQWAIVYINRCPRANSAAATRHDTLCALRTALQKSTLDASSAAPLANLPSDTGQASAQQWNT